MAATSVKALQLRPDADSRPQDTCEHSALCRALETREFAARIGAAAVLGSAGDESAVASDEPKQVALRRAPATADAGSLRPQKVRGTFWG
jgi:hypothetical protein